MGATKRGTRKNKGKQDRKKAEKEANKAKWEALKKSGDNGKGARTKKNIKRGANTVSHPMGKCGNIGCKQCNPKLYE